MKFLVAAAVFTLFAISALADIAPNPIQIKGIIPSHPVSIQMISEIVTVQLSMDSSEVECTFYMRNLGKSQNIEIGFPMMNFYLFDLNREHQESDKNKFDVSVNGLQLDNINLYMPGKLKKILDSAQKTLAGYSLLSKYNDQYKPWYLWKAHFSKNELQVIKVRYVLPNGATKANRFFNYLLSTGAGWQGKIKRAQVIVHIKDIPADQVLNISPRNYKMNGGIISWDFRNLKPTKGDDILINYEEVKGAYEAAEKKIDSTRVILNDKLLKFGAFHKVNPDDIASVQINRNHPYEKYGAIYIYTKDYALENFKENLSRSNKTAWKQVSKIPSNVMLHNYRLIINGKQLDWYQAFGRKSAADSVHILRLGIKKTGLKKRELILITKE